MKETQEMLSTIAIVLFILLLTGETSARRPALERLAAAKKAAATRKHSETVSRALNFGPAPPLTRRQ